MRSAAGRQGSSVKRCDCARKMKPRLTIEVDMLDSVIFSLIYGPIVVTLGCWMFFAIEASRAHKEAVVRILSRRQRLDRRRPGP
jgi:hypothetical protein